MEWLRWQTNPWGQEILRGLSWDTAWFAIASGLLIAIVHSLIYVWRWRSKKQSEAANRRGISDSGTSRVPSEQVPGRVVRHSFASRIFHWVMAASMLALLFTGFLPILGLKFSWVTSHWIAGLVLTGAILFHIVHASFWKGLASMWISLRDLRDGWLTLRGVVGFPQPAPGNPGKNPLENKLFHHVTGIATLAVIVTGLIMMVKVDGPFWTRNPYFLPDDIWGIIYVVHGAASVAFITLIIVHLYFAARPEKRWITLSMIFGWIPRERYLENYDPQRWPVSRQDFREATSPWGQDRPQGREIQ